ncbi:hypothetical protein LOC67_19200 [Stieleria sp. JC731]|uniref:hypothetical protein n=1 Tax=Pirellulaceae TaxID=2691357 RepID=UPI001E5A9FE1|nr:hypothetical protein [Stieleria sp. JC731]MCC9602683.1 hypothetical protein [Stieleria sp. JC731]
MTSEQTGSDFDSANLPGPNRFIYVVSGCLLVAVAGYYAFTAMNTMGLATHHGNAIVVGKYFQEAGTSSFSQPIGNQQIVRVQETPEAYIAKVKINEQQTECALDKPLYEEVSPGDQLNVEYQVTRLTGAIRITKATR